MSIALEKEGQSVVLEDVSWREYTRLLRVFDDRPGLRLTYDRGRLEIMTLSAEHEGYGYSIGRLVDALTEELGLPIMGGGSTTLRRQLKRRGLEPDNCYWIENAQRVIPLKDYDLKKHPPPDLALEVDVTRSSLDRMGIYAALRVPQVWHWDGQTFTFFGLQQDGEYAPIAAPSFASFLTVPELLRFIRMFEGLDVNAVVREFRQWLRTQLGQRPTSRSSGNGQGNGESTPTPPPSPG